jgi:hypothetical protein
MVEAGASTAGEGLTKVVHRTRVGQQDAHYGGGLVDGARILGLFWGRWRPVRLPTESEENPKSCGPRSPWPRVRISARFDPRQGGPMPAIQKADAVPGRVAPVRRPALLAGWGALRLASPGGRALPERSLAPSSSPTAARVGVGVPPINNFGHSLCPPGRPGRVPVPVRELGRHHDDHPCGHRGVLNCQAAEPLPGRPLRPRTRARDGPGGERDRHVLLVPGRHVPGGHVMLIWTHGRAT